MTKELEKAIRSFRLYHGSSGCRLGDQQKLYTRALRACGRIAIAKNMAVSDVVEQIGAEAMRRGGIMPIPGKDI